MFALFTSTGRFIPENWLNLPGMSELYVNATVGIDPRLCTVGDCKLSTCDIAATGPGAGDRMLRYLNDSIREEHFERMAAAGFNFVRLPLGYWNVLDVEDAPDAPAHDAARWLALQRMLPASSYAPHIDRVIRLAQRHRLRVLLDLHGAPGGRMPMPNRAVFEREADLLAFSTPLPHFRASRPPPRLSSPTHLLRPVLRLRPPPPRLAHIRPHLAESINQCTGCAQSCEGGACEPEAHYFMRPANRRVAIKAVVQMAKICERAGDTCYGVGTLRAPTKASLRSYCFAAHDWLSHEGWASPFVTLPSLYLRRVHSQSC